MEETLREERFKEKWQEAHGERGGQPRLQIYKRAKEKPMTL